MNEIELTEQQVNQLYQMMQSPGWGVLTTKVLPSWLSTLHIHLESPVSTEREDAICKGSVAAVRNILGYETIIKQAVEEK